MSVAPTEQEKHHLRRSRRAATATLAAVLTYLGVTYFVAPEWWWHHEGGLDRLDMRTTTTDGIPGDPINIGLVGARDDVLLAFAAAKWRPADAITLKTSVEIGLSVVGSSADERHHIRLWRIDPLTTPGNGPLWLGSTSFDRGVGVSHDTGQITHHIGPDLDAERDFVIHDLTTADWIGSTYEIEGSGATEDGRNGGGDRYFTDGKAIVGVLTEGK